MVKNKEIGKMKYEEALDELKEVISALEIGKLDLESLIEKYEYGKTLLDHCQKLLESAELKIQKLDKEGKKIDMEKGAI